MEKPTELVLAENLQQLSLDKPARLGAVLDGAALSIPVTKPSGSKHHRSSSIRQKAQVSAPSVATTCSTTSGGTTAWEQRPEYFYEDDDEPAQEAKLVETQGHTTSSSATNFVSNASTASTLSTNTSSKSKKTKDAFASNASVSSTSDATATSSKQALAPLGSVERALADYQFFIQYTYTPECALVGYNFTEALQKLGVFDHFTANLEDRRIIAVQLMYLFYKYQLHHNDMCLDLALALTYLEEAVKSGFLKTRPTNDGFNMIMYTVYLAHTWNNDRTVCLADWFKEIGWQTFPKCCVLNDYVLRLFRDMRKYQLRASTDRMREWVLCLCAAPQLQ